MSETITFHALDLSGETALKLFLRKNDGSLLNADGDALTEISSSGVFAATLAESRTGLGSLSVRVCDGTETADNLLFDGFLPEGSTVIGQAVELDSASINAVQSGLATAAEVAKIPKVGSTHRYTQVAADSGTKRTDVAITDTP